MPILKHIPNFLTSLNLFLGAAGVLMALSGRPDLTACAILVAALLDFLDGFAARLLNAYSTIGKDLDSLADLISFGMAPAAVYISLLSFTFTGSWEVQYFQLSLLQQAWLLLPLVIPVFSALRLARFNNDTRQTETFLGLTTTAAGMFSVSLIFMTFTGNPWWQWTANPWVVLTLVVIFCALLVSEIPMFSLKFKRFGLRGNLLRYLLLVGGLISLILFGVGGIAVTILFYILFSLGKYFREIGLR